MVLILRAVVAVLAVVAVVCRFLPASPRGHAALFWALVAVTVVYSLGCITRLIPWQRVPLWGHALAVTALQPPVVAASLWLTGGSDAYMGPVLVLPMLYVAYFSPAPLRVAARRARGPAPTPHRSFIALGPHHRCLRRAASPTRSPTSGLDADHPVPQAAHGRRREPSAPDGPRGPAHRPRRTAAPSTTHSTARWIPASPFTLLLADVDAFKSHQRHSSATRPATARPALPGRPRAPPSCAPATAWPASAATSST